MNVSSLELSKELYELSEWGEEVAIQWWVVRPKHKIDGVEHEEFAYVDDYSDRAKTDRGEYAIPAYNLGYLLRKLPSHTYSTQYEQKAYLWMRKDSDVYCAWYKVTDPNYGEDITSEHGAVCDTPEDAACKLAIELFKQGILKKGES